MEYRQLGRSGLKVSPLCLGTMMFGGPTDEAESRRIIDRAAGQGINFIDTADLYTEGRSEEIVGRAIRERRDWWILATKFGQPGTGRPNRQGLSRRHAQLAVQRSLKRLGVEAIDILYLHREDLETPLEETVHAVADMIRAGHVRYFGVSNFRAWRIAEIVRLCDAFGIDRPVVSQPLYNALNRGVEVEHLPACQHYGLGVVPYSPLARGVLTGKYVPGEEPGGETRAGRNDRRMMEVEWRPESLGIAAQLAGHARMRNIAPGQFALAWLLNNRLVTSPVAGPRTLEQWDAYVAALDYSFTSEDEALVDRLVATGHASSPGFNDPAYPVTGRQPRTHSAP